MIPLTNKESEKSNLGSSAYFKYKLKSPIFTNDIPTDPGIEEFYANAASLIPSGKPSPMDISAVNLIVARLKTMQTFSFLSAMRHMLATQFPLTANTQFPAFLCSMWAESLLDYSDQVFERTKPKPPAAPQRYLAAAGLLMFRRTALDNIVQDGLKEIATNPYYRGMMDSYSKLLSYKSAKDAFNHAANAWPADRLKKDKIINTADLLVPTLHLMYVEAKELGAQFRFTPDKGWISRKGSVNTQYTIDSWIAEAPIVKVLLRDYQLGALAILTALNVSGRYVFTPGHRHSRLDWRKQHLGRYSKLRSELIMMNQALDQVDISISNL